MRVILISFIVLCYSLGCKAQELTYKMLEYFYSHDFNNSSDYLKKNGYDVKMFYTPAGNYPGHYYRLIKGEGIKSIELAKQEYGVSAFFYSIEHFLTLKKYIENDLGLNLDSVKRLTTGTSYFYHSGNLSIYLSEGWSYVTESKSSIRSYSIQLINEDLFKKRDPYKIEW